MIQPETSETDLGKLQRCMHAIQSGSTFFLLHFFFVFIQFTNPSLQNSLYKYPHFLFFQKMHASRIQRWVGPLRKLGDYFGKLQIYMHAIQSVSTFFFFIFLHLFNLQILPSKFPFISIHFLFFQKSMLPKMGWSS